MSIADAALPEPLLPHPRAEAVPTATAPARPHLDQQPCEGDVDTGTSSGVNIAPGSDDDGWTVPPPVVLSDSTRIQLYKDGEALHAAYSAIENAKRRICLEVYIFHDDDTGRAFAELLAAKARDGVKVYVLYDSFGSIGTDRRMFAMMRRAGVNVKEFHPIRPWEGRYSWRPFNRDHRKLLIIDDQIAGLGGLNVGAEYAGSWVLRAAGSRAKDGPCDVWRDNAMGIVGPGARQFLAAFASAWSYATRGGRIRRAELYTGLDGSGELGVLASVPTMDSPLVPFLAQLTRSARRSIELTMSYFAPPDELIDGLCRAAKRGVRVRLMLAAKSDVHLLTVAARSFYETLLTAGVEVYERQHAVLHAKTGVVDEETTVLGSTNLDYRSIEYNLELSAIVRSRAFGRHVHELFENDVKYARRITLKEWRRRPSLDRLGCWAVNRARYLL
jgi:cardiolipin synthase A/B